MWSYCQSLCDAEEFNLKFNVFLLIIFSGKTACMRRYKIMFDLISFIDVL